MQLCLVDFINVRCRLKLPPTYEVLPKLRLNLMICLLSETSNFGNTMLCEVGAIRACLSGLVFNDIYCVNGRLTQLMEWLGTYLKYCYYVDDVVATTYRFAGYDYFFSHNLKKTLPKHLTLQFLKPNFEK